MPAKGSIHFLKAVGFSEEKQIVTDGHEPETFYVMDAGVVGKPILVIVTSTCRKY